MSSKGSADASKGCRTCMRRRIRCDLGRPECSKCIKKGLSCPGYGRHLRWADGVAVRGKLKGRRLPVAGSMAMELALPTIEEPVPLPAPALPPPPSPITGALQVMGQTALSINKAIESTSAGTDLLNFTQWASSPEIIEYYDKYLAGRMVWIDSDENDYRRRMLPMAANAPGLRFAIAAFSLYHGPMKFPSELARYHEEARDACLEVLQRQLREMNTRVNSGAELNTRADVANAEWMLACILVIANYEMAKNHSVAAENHRLAARRIVNVFGQHEACTKGLFAFLRNQLAIHEVLGSCTSFDLADVAETILPTPGSGSHVLFSEYLSFLHQITLASRRSMAVNEDIDVSLWPESFTIIEVQSRFEQARGQTLMIAGKLQINPPVVRRDFIRLVDLYHHAAVVYAYRCLGYAVPSNFDWLASVTKLFDQLDQIENISLCIQNLPWPIFIAGTECHGDTERQHKVATILDKTIRTTGFNQYETIRSFLNAFWSGTEPNWLPVAQQLQANGLRILVV
ncbi:Zn(2)-C6 fungal-type domain-containing protein [Trichoderma simmonsii]|uniref:Zn(2)-C6 fungal-type domain-containing protein n=2 Tax=Trichoderma simmonsii TaxID=1491479 RepID=A0A8G0PI23_9HYPO|nr:Zn(2)-C6 fungal-type domain-containing protein [Trichoderma simmonsii]